MATEALETPPHPRPLGLLPPTTHSLPTPPSPASTHHPTPPARPPAHQPIPHPPRPGCTCCSIPCAPPIPCTHPTLHRCPSILPTPGPALPPGVPRAPDSHNGMGQIPGCSLVLAPAPGAALRAQPPVLRPLSHSSNSSFAVSPSAATTGPQGALVTSGCVRSWPGAPIPPWHKAQHMGCCGGSVPHSQPGSSCSGC